MAKKIIFEIASGFPILSTFCGAVLACALCGYVGYIVAARITFRHEQAIAFDALGSDGPRFKELVQTLQTVAVSKILTQNNRESLRENVEDLQALRSQATQDVWPIIDLGIATDYVVMARLEERTNNTAESSVHRQAAASLLRSLGWKDVSDPTLDDLADKRLKKRPGK
jgi:copper homeostasis protein CutC